MEFIFLASGLITAIAIDRTVQPDFRMIRVLLFGVPFVFLI